MGDSMDDARGDIRGDHTDAVRWMTYAELGAARGISTASATRLAFRRKWRRQGGNDKTARVAVPIGEAQPKSDKPMMSGVTSGDYISQVVSGFAAALAALKERADAEAQALRERIEAAEAEGTALRGQLAAAERRTDKAETRATTAEDEAVALRGRIEAQQRRVEQAEAELVWMREADELRRSRGVLARLRAAWRGE